MYTHLRAVYLQIWVSADQAGYPLWAEFPIWYSRWYPTMCTARQQTCQWVFLSRCTLKLESIRDRGKLSPKTILELWYIAVSSTCEHFGLTEDTSSGDLRRKIPSVQFIDRAGGWYTNLDWPWWIDGVNWMDAPTEMPSWRAVLYKLRSRPSYLNLKLVSYFGNTSIWMPPMSFQGHINKGCLKKWREAHFSSSYLAFNRVSFAKRHRNKF